MSFETSLKTTDSGGNSYDRWYVIPENWSMYTERPITNQSVGPRDDKTSFV